MRFSDIRQTLLKGIDEPSQMEVDGVMVDNPATPKWISPVASGYIAAALAGKEKDVPQPAKNRRYVRAVQWRPRYKKRGVALTPGEMPWKQDVPAAV